MASNVFPPRSRKSITWAANACGLRCLYGRPATARTEIDKDLMIDKFLHEVGVEQSKSDVFVRYHRSLPVSEEDVFPAKEIKSEV